MNILDDVIDNVREDAPIEDVRRGLHWTAVVTEGCGLASSMFEGGCEPDKGANTDIDFTDKMALSLARRCIKGSPSMASVGLAAINSIINIDNKDYESVNGLDMITRFSDSKNVSIIGHFPLLDDIAKKAANLWIIEKRPQPGDHPEESGSKLIPRSDLVIISSTTLLNGTLPGILDLCRKNSVKMLLGPSTPLSTVLFDYGIDMLAGSVVTSKETVIKSVSEGATFMQLKKRGGIRFFTMIKDYDDVMKKLS